MKARVTILGLFLFLFSSKAQIRNIVYVDASSDIADNTRDEWQDSLEKTLSKLNDFETLIFLSNQKSPSISTPEKYVNIVNDLGSIRPNTPLADEDFRLILQALDKFTIEEEIKIHIYTSNQVFRSNDLGRLLFDRIGLLLIQSANDIELNYYLHQSDTLKVFTPPTLFDSQRTITYF